MLGSDSTRLQPWRLAGGDLDGLVRLHFDRGEDSVHEAVKDLFYSALNGWKSGLAELRAGQTAAHCAD